MRTLMLGAAMSLALCTPALAQTVSLDAIAGQTAAGSRPQSPDKAPKTISIRPELAATLRAQVLDGGREVGLFLAYEDGRLRFDRAVGGQRYTAPGACPDCDFQMPLNAHTHPYENPFSVIDITLVAQRNAPSLVVTTRGMYLALPTMETQRTQPFGELRRRYALFGNRLECPAAAPDDGWSAPTAMGRNVEGPMRGAAAALGVAIYVLDGDTFRRIDGVDASDPVFDPAHRVTLADLNLYEATLLRVMAAATRAGWTGAFDAAADDPEWMALMTRMGEGGRTPADYDAMPFIRDRTNPIGRLWFEALPTTVYGHPFADQSVPDLPFTSVQYSPDCAEVWVLRGRQGFRPETVVYEAGWRQARDGGMTEAGWTPMAPADLPTGHAVPWGSSAS